MIQNNPNFTNTVGTIKQQIANFNGMADVKMYTPEEKEKLTNARPATDLQNSIYNLPNEKLLAFGVDSAPKSEKGE